MFEIKIMIEAPELSGAMMRLADAISAKPAAYSPAAPAASAEAAPAKPAEVKQAAKPAEPKKEAKPAKEEKPAPAPEAAPAPVKPEPAPVKPEPAPAPAAPAPTPAPVPAAETTQPEKPLDLATIARAGAGLVDQGKMPQIMELLKHYQVRAITELKQEQYSDFAKDLRALGAAI